MAVRPCCRAGPGTKAAMLSQHARNLLLPAANCPRCPRCWVSRIITSTPSSVGRSIPKGRLPMRMPDALLLCALGAAAFGISGARGEGTNLGKPIAPSDLAMWDIDVEPDGTGLPAGGGS